MLGAGLRPGRGSAGQRALCQHAHGVDRGAAAAGAAGGGAATPKEAAPALELAQQEVNRLLEQWDDGLADRLFADNFFLDDSREWWQGEMGRLAAVHGRLREEGPFEAENALRGTWKLVGERGWVKAFVTLTPTVPPRVQALELESVLPPGPALGAAVEELVKLINRPSQRGASRLFVKETRPADQHTFYDKIRMVAALCGECRVGRYWRGTVTAGCACCSKGPRQAYRRI